MQTHYENVGAHEIPRLRNSIAHRRSNQSKAERLAFYGQNPAANNKSFVLICRDGNTQKNLCG
jgi:hypothetical protein